MVLCPMYSYIIYPSMVIMQHLVFELRLLQFLANQSTGGLAVVAFATWAACLGRPGPVTHKEERGKKREKREKEERKKEKEKKRKKRREEREEDLRPIMGRLFHDKTLYVIAL